MQRRFNEGQYWQRMQNGEFTEVIVSTHIAQKGILKRHPNAQGVTARYRNNDGYDIVEVHYYWLLPEKRIIPGMRPDPKILFENGTLFHLERKQPPVWKTVCKAAIRAFKAGIRRLRQMRKRWQYKRRKPMA